MKMNICQLLAIIREYQGGRGYRGYRRAKKYLGTIGHFGSVGTAKRGGFTLIELIIYIGITSVVVVSLMNVMITVLETRERTESISEVQQSMRAVMDRIAVTYIDAQEVSIGASDFESVVGSLYLIMSGSTRNPTIFSLVDGVIKVKEGGGNAQQISANTIVIDKFHLHRVDEGVVEVQLHAFDKASDELGEREDMSLETTFTLRQ